MMESYDIVIVGGGPAGSSAAMTAAKSGLKVLMVEKRAEIGSPKRCGEGLSKSSLRGWASRKTTAGYAGPCLAQAFTPQTGRK